MLARLNKMWGGAETAESARWTIAQDRLRRIQEGTPYGQVVQTLHLPRHDGNIEHIDYLHPLASLCWLCKRSPQLLDTLRQVSCAKKTRLQ